MDYLAKILHVPVLQTVFYNQIILMIILLPLKILLQIYVFQHVLRAGLEIILHLGVFKDVRIILMLIVQQGDVSQDVLVQKGFMMILQHGDVSHNVL